MALAVASGVVGLVVVAAGVLAWGSVLNGHHLTAEVAASATSRSPSPTPPPTPAVGALMRLVGPGLPAAAAWSPTGTSFAIVDAPRNGSAIVRLYASNGRELRSLDGWDLAWTDPRHFLVRRSAGVGEIVAGSLDNADLASVRGSFAGLLTNGHGAAALELPGTDPVQAQFLVWRSGTLGTPRAGQPVAWSPDGSLLAVVHVTSSAGSTGGEDVGWLEVLRGPDLVSVAAVHSIDVGARGTPVLFSPDGSHLAIQATSAGEPIVAILDLNSGRIASVRVGRVQSVAWRGRNELLVVESDREQIGAFDVNGKSVASGVPFALGLAASPTGILATHALDSGSLTLRTVGRAQVLDVCGRRLGDISWAPDGEHLLVGCEQLDGSFATALIVTALSGSALP